jgi:hypothetical protein
MDQAAERAGSDWVRQPAIDRQPLPASPMAPLGEAAVSMARQATTPTTVRLFAFVSLRRDLKDLFVGRYQPLRLGGATGHVELGQDILGNPG